MIKFENTEVMGWEAAIRGMRNPMNSWDKSDSEYTKSYVDSLNPDVWKKAGETEEYIGRERDGYKIGPNDLNLMKCLWDAGTDHRKFMRMITVYVDITAPLYWWKEFDTYKVGTVANSCSTMHKIHAKEFTFEDFSCEHMTNRSINRLQSIIADLNFWREAYICKDVSERNQHLINNEWYDTYVPTKKDCWWQMIQLLPTSYNQRRTVMLNYEVLANIYKSRKKHKLDEWAEHSKDEIVKDALNGSFGFCDWIKTLPYSELITGGFVKEEK